MNAVLKPLGKQVRQILPPPMIIILIYLLIVQAV